MENATSRENFAALLGGQHVDAIITFEHGPGRAVIHHSVTDASVAYILSVYARFTSIQITRVIALQPGASGVVRKP